MSYLRNYSIIAAMAANKYEGDVNMTREEQNEYIISLLYQLGLVEQEEEVQPVLEADHDFPEII